MEQQVYFIRDEISGNIKIGVAIDPKKRLLELQTGASGSLTILHTETGDSRHEMGLHKRFAEDRIRGEWFRPSDALMAYITRDHKDESKSLEISEPRNLRSYDCPLVGHYFHTFKPCEIEGRPAKRVHWQAQVISEVSPGIYLCQLFEWIGGQESNRVLMRIESLLECDFYETAQEMANAYRNQWSRVAEAANRKPLQQVAG